MTNTNAKLGLPTLPMQKYWVAFDVDGTLISNTEPVGYIANEDIRTLLIILSKFKNVKILVWSGGGEIYARQVCGSLGINKYVDKYMSKQDWNDWVYKHNVIAIDDIQDTNLGNIANLIVRQK